MENSGSGESDNIAWWEGFHDWIDDYLCDLSIEQATRAVKMGKAALQAIQEDMIKDWRSAYQQGAVDEKMDRAYYEEEKAKEGEEE
jgi:hypothetical protein